MITVEKPLIKLFLRWTNDIFILSSTASLCLTILIDSYYDLQPIIRTKNIVYL